MARQKTRPANKVAAERYKLEDRSTKNKIRKLEKRIRKNPEDKGAKDALEKIKEKGYNRRSKPLSPGSNKPDFVGFYISNVNEVEHPKTAGEQLSELLGIPMPKPRKQRVKTKFYSKKKRNVKKQPAKS